MDFDASNILTYLGLPEDYECSPSRDPITFLARHLRQLPPHLLAMFSAVTTPKQRTVFPTIRNRRSMYADSNPPELSFSAAKTTWPTLWHGREVRGRDEGKEEQEWAEKEFLAGSEKHIGKIGTLLGEYEEEREAERVRTLRRQQAELVESLPEEDEDTDDEDLPQTSDAEEEETAEEAQASFVRLIREKYIYGLLESIDYDKVDWDESWDMRSDRDEEERWFDEEEESIALDE